MITRIARACCDMFVILTFVLYLLISKCLVFELIVSLFFSKTVNIISSLSIRITSSKLISLMKN